MDRAARRSLGVLWLLLAVGCTADERAGDVGDTEAEPGLTYYRDIKPILDAKCVGCHDGGSVAPFDFTEADGVMAVRELIGLAVEGRSMPPWPPAPGCNDYFADRSLTEDQILRIGAWMGEGSPVGDPDDVGTALEPTPAIALSRVDHTLPMATPYVPGPEPDDYRCFVVDWPEPGESYLTGLRFNPGEARLVHHGIVYVAGPASAEDLCALEGVDEAAGYECFGGPEVPAGWLGVWVPGASGGDFPADTGIRVEPGSKVVLQVHYSANPSGLSDQTSVDVSVAPSVGHAAWIQPWMDPSWFEPDGLTIPAGAPSTSVSSALDPVFFVGGGEPIKMHTVGLHMHLLGSAGRLSLERADGSEECLLEIPNWDFHWQGAYALEEPPVLRLGDRLRIECTWDNGAENQPIVDGDPLEPKDTVWGEGTRDEMCLGAMYLTAE